MILYIIYICIITENPVFIHAWFRPPLGFADATSRFPSGWVSALAWTWAKIMFGMVQKKISCMCMYIYIHIIPYIYTLWRMGFILFQHVWYQNGAGYELRNRHLHGTALRWSCSPFCYFQNKFFPVSMRTCYIYIVYDIVYYIYTCIITVSMRTCQLATAGWKPPDLKTLVLPRV